jgi:ribosome-associated protein
MSDKNKLSVDNNDYLESLKNLINKTLEDGKADEISILDVSDSTDLCHYMIIASGTSSRHISSLADKVVFDIKHSDLDTKYHCEGLASGNWVLIDCLDIIVHLFLPEARDEFNLEELWS